MSGRFTRKMYDGCAFQQDVRQSTSPLDYQLDPTKYVNCNNLCQPKQYPENSAQLVDVESSLWGLDKLSSKCDEAKHPFCAKNGCLLTKDPRVGPHMDPLACEWNHVGDRNPGVISTNMVMPRSNGIPRQNPNVCNAQRDIYPGQMVPMRQQGQMMRQPVNRM